MCSLGPTYKKKQLTNANSLTTAHCKHKDKCNQLHPLHDSSRDCEDRRACTKRHKIQCTNKVLTSEHKLQDMTDRVEAIEEEYSARLEEHENALNKLANLPKVDTFKKL